MKKLQLRGCTAKLTSHTSSTRTACSARRPVPKTCTPNQLTNFNREESKTLRMCWALKIGVGCEPSSCASIQSLCVAIGSSCVGSWCPGVPTRTTRCPGSTHAGYRGLSILNPSTGHPKAEVLQAGSLVQSRFLRGNADRVCLATSAWAGRQVRPVEALKKGTRE